MVSKRRLLEALVAAHERSDRPRSTEQLADELDADPSGIREGLESLRSYELLEFHDGEGYTPTITAYELLELDLDDEFLVIEVPDESTEE